ncbi:MAG: hypothetical protein KDK38_07590 [Leptospiraceae bacterium]|nr:hypothetical protein [Leptospiraceae bacterium]
MNHKIILLGLMLSTLFCARFRVENLSETVVFSSDIKEGSLSFPSQSGVVHGIPRTVGVSGDRIVISEPDNRQIRIFRGSKQETRIITKEKEKDKNDKEAEILSELGVKSVASEYLKVPGNIVAGGDDDFFVLNYYPNLSAGSGEQGGFYKILHFDLKGKFLRVIGRNGQPELPFENVLWMDLDTEKRLWVLYRYLDELFLDSYVDGKLYRGIKETECREQVFAGRVFDKTLIARCEFMYPFPKGDKILLIGRVDKNADDLSKSAGRVFQYRTFAARGFEGESKIIFANLNDPEDYPYLPRKENEIFIWQTLDYDRVKFAIYNLDGDLINNLQITRKGRFEHWRSTWYSMQSESFYSLRVGPDKFEVLRW